MNFIKPKTEIKLFVDANKDIAEKIGEDLKSLLANVNPAELALLAKAVKNPLIKSVALKKLKEFN